MKRLNLSLLLFLPAILVLSSVISACGALGDPIPYTETESYKASKAAKDKKEE